MKVEVTHASIVNDMGVVATVELVDDVTVKINVNQYIGWNDWLDLTDAVRRVMLLMEVKQP
tara:strand:- start:378 stop:560 length:183 start_codon:yes stop_codon:yes gene_type:complete